MNKQEILPLLRELHKISGFRVSLRGPNLEEIASYPEDYLPFCAKVNQAEEEHAICMECGKVVDVYLDDLKEQIKKRIDGEFKNYNLTIDYVCNDCLKNKNN